MAAIHPLSSCLILSLCILSVSADVFLSIDCGSSTNSYTDENLIAWTGDGDGRYISGGETHTVPKNNSISHVLDTLRAFPTGKKHCYYIDSIRRGRVLVRATFYYGNYDGKSSPPTFDLFFDGNPWATVETSSSEYYYYEVIYVMKKDTISVCVGRRNDGGLPLISALEIRGLESYMYQFLAEDRPMFTLRRVAYGTNATIRSFDDPYDRIWTGDVGGRGSTQVTSTALLNPITFLDSPPPAVLRHAVTAVTPNSTLQLFMGFPPYIATAYINWFFTEVAVVQPNQTRNFTLFMGNRSYSSPIEPIYGNLTQLYVSNVTVSPNTTFSLVPNAGSTLPPLISALEVYLIGNVLTEGTNGTDVDGLSLLQDAFGVLKGWSGDPCLPAPYSWEWINCSSDSTPPRVTALFLGSFGLSGAIPNISSMDALQIIDLHNNSLNGSIPDSLSSLPNLKQLNLADNKLSGSVPSSLSQKNGLNLVVSGNPDLCLPGAICPTTKPGSSGNSLINGKMKNNILVTIITSLIIVSISCTK
ncbi:hypothetical protein ABFS82_14G248800 [Erythranthe guttata]|uniref:probable LRR receptor-like serine/threonine-protein kinase At1g05700 n=1 Tax=Erythranthe guttata TaxID=4155 RepID=UPI00064D9B2B|nr:PREDICTED: probable LRR receptor-like serine/threonine-protein kinase At1g05700 [Erythranthe guttata]|eukprot:XP_012838669.1 PREDICTED: probable LRR receptor-like serine/threonine-protein kinase At1g05700 [Erythranthe guttata]